METRIDGATVFTGKIFRVERDRVRMDDGREATREIVRGSGWGKPTWSPGGPTS